MPGDIMHCPSKRVYASWVIEKHLARVGLNCYDVVAITRDGGGERERARGVHRYFEVSSLAMSTYLVDGFTWIRMR